MLQYNGSAVEYCDKMGWTLCKGEWTTRINDAIDLLMQGTPMPGSGGSYSSATYGEFMDTENFIVLDENGEYAESTNWLKLAA